MFVCVGFCGFDLLNCTIALKSQRILTMLPNMIDMTQDMTPSKGSGRRRSPLTNLNSKKKQISPPRTACANVLLATASSATPRRRIEIWHTVYKNIASKTIVLRPLLFGT